MLAVQQLGRWLAANCICNVTGNKSVDKGDKGLLHARHADSAPEH